MRSICAFAVTALLLPAAPPLASAADDLPMQRGGGPIVGGKRQQPTQSEIQERQLERSMTAPSRAGAPSPGQAGDRDRQSQDLYNRVIQQSDRPTPRSIDPTQ